MRTINFDDWFNTKPREVKLGVELELLLFDLETKKLLNDGDLIYTILDKMPNQIWKDYYAYQLEIRTKPSGNVEKILAETVKLYKIASKEMLDNNILVIPSPILTQDNGVPCGLHVHISYPKMDKLNPFFGMAMGMYPFILSIADHTKNSEVNSYQNSWRINNSMHIGLPYLDAHTFMNRISNTDRYRDIIYSPMRSLSDDRSKMSKPNTIEIRIFDTPSLFSHYKFIIESVYYLSKYIKEHNPLEYELKNNFEVAKNNLYLTREMIKNQRYGVNKVFKMLNSNVCLDFAEKFGIKFPSETQFEFRERYRLSADINGYLSMATKGGWL